MSAWDTLTDEGNAARRGVITLFTITGAILAWWWKADGPDYPRLFLGLACLALGMGLWQNWPRARWLALGACYLAVINAFAMPVLLAIWKPFENLSEGVRQVELFTFAASAAVGVIGYKGLGYLRSPAAWDDFSSNEKQRVALSDEPSYTVLLSAIFVAIALAAAALARGAGSPGLPRAASENAPSDQGQESPSASAPSNYFDVLLEPETIGHPNQADVIPLGFCRRRDLLKQVIYIAYANVGWNRSLDKTLRFSTGRDLGQLTLFNGPRLTMPEYNHMLLAEFAVDAPEVRGTWFVNFDADNGIPEEDETNNAARLEISANPDGSLALPDCDDSALRILARDGPTLTTSTVKLPGTLPDLVPLGLCGRGEVYVSVQYTNRGAPARGLFWISQGHGISDLEVVDQAYHSVGDAHQAHGRNVGLISTLIGARGQSAEVAIKLDAMDAIHESDETNNIASARVTRLADGTVDLPDCDVVAARAADPEFIPDEVALQPVMVPFPDLIPLGLCFKDWGAGSTFIQVVYGNIGTVRSSLEFRVSMHDAPVVSSSAYVPKFHVPPPGGIAIADPGLRADDARAQEVVTVDPSNVILELNDSNNTMQFAIARRPDGRVDLPECDSVRGPASKWSSSIILNMGPE